MKSYLQAIISRIKCFFVGHDVAGSPSIVATFCCDYWIKKCNRCGRFILHDPLGSISMSEKEAMKFKKKFEALEYDYRNRNIVQ